MHKSSAEDFLSCGIDVSAAQLVVALEGEAGGWRQRSFANRASGHQALIRWLQKTGERVRVCLEATGRYSLDLALALHAADPGAQNARRAGHPLLCVVKGMGQPPIPTFATQRWASHPG